MASLLPRGQERMQGMRRHLMRLVIGVRKAAPSIILEGLRSRERQMTLVALGPSRIMNNRHLTGHAVDLGYWLDDGDGVPENGEICWGWPLYAQRASAVKGAAQKLGVAIIRSSYWPSFPDGPHFELDRGDYP